MHTISHMRGAALDVSVILPFSDDEEVVGRACRRIAEHLRELGARFELIAVDEDSGDNSHTVLALVRGEVPELRVMVASDADRGSAEGARQARGRVLWLVAPRVALSPLSPLSRAWRRVAEGRCDVAVVRGRFAVCHRTRCLPLIDSIRSGEGYVGRLEKRAAARRFDVEVLSAESGSADEAPARPVARPGAQGHRFEGAFSRVLGALKLAR